MRTVVILLAGISMMLGGCRVHNSKADPPKEDNKDEGEGVNITDSTNNGVGVVLNIGDERVYKSEPLTINWAADDGAKCELKANDTELGKDLDSKGSLIHAPDADTSYTMTCTKGELTGSATVSMKLLIEKTVAIPLFEKEDMATLFDLSLLVGDQCTDGKPCYFADLEKDLFKKTPDGWDETETLVKLLESSQQTAPEPRVIAFEQMAATFDLNSSAVYGYQGSIADLKLDDTCKAGNPYKVGMPIASDMVFSNSTGNGFEELSEGLLNVAVFTDLKIEGKARRSVVLKGSELSATYWNAEVTGKISGNYQDYSAASGKFAIESSQVGSDRIAMRSESFPLESETFAASPVTLRNAKIYPPVPAGYVLPARGYGGDQNAFIPTDMYCNVKRQLVQEHPLAPQVWYGPVSDYFPQSGSKRIVVGPATIQCNEVNKGDALVYSIGPEWKMEKADAWWFVTDRNWPSCGGYDCLGKDIIMSMANPSWDEVEPHYNHCIDRWAGLNYGKYIFSLIDGCRETDVYKNAVKQAKETANDIAFYQKCIDSPACQAVPFALFDLQDGYPLEKTKALLKIARQQTDNAKSLGQSFLLTDKKFSKREINAGQRALKRLQENFDTYESMRVAVSPSVNGLARFPDINVPEFSSSELILKAMDEYEAIFKEVLALADPSAAKIGCSFTASGKFRRYEGISLSEVKITPLTKTTKALPILRDFRVEP